MSTERLSHSGRKHSGSKKPPPPSVGEALKRAARRLGRAKLHYGHGTDNATDEAAALLAHAIGREQLVERDLARRISAAAMARFEILLTRRIDERVPAVYLTQRCWFAGIPMHVDERVLIPRSPIAELIEAHFRPWVDPAAVKRLLDVGTGSGCIAIAAALAFPAALVDAVDISRDALAVAAINRRMHGLGRRVRLLESSYFKALKGQRYTQTERRACAQYRAVSLMAFRMSDVCGRMASSRSGWYATGTFLAPTRRTGASRCSNSSPAMRAAISAPKPHVT